MVSKYNILIKSKEKGLIKGIRHLMIHLDTKEINNNKDLINSLNELAEEGIAEKIVDFDQEKTFYRPTDKARVITKACVHDSTKLRLEYFKCLWNVIYNDIENYNARLYEIGVDFHNNYGINIFKSLREHQDIFSNFRLSDETINNFENYIKAL